MLEIDCPILLLLRVCKEIIEEVARLLMFLP